MTNLYALQTWDWDAVEWFTNTVVDQDYYYSPEGAWMRDPKTLLVGMRVAKYTLADVVTMGEDDREDTHKPVPGEEPPCKSQS